MDIKNFVYLLDTQDYFYKHPSCVIDLEEFKKKFAHFKGHMGFNVSLTTSGNTIGLPKYMTELIKHMKWTVKKVADNKKLYQTDYFLADSILNPKEYSLELGNPRIDSDDNGKSCIFCLRDSEELAEFIKGCVAGKIFTKRPFESLAPSTSAMQFVVFDNLQQLQQSIVEVASFVAPDEKMYQEFLEVYKTFSTIMPQIITDKSSNDFEKHLVDIGKVFFGGEYDEEYYFGCDPDKEL